MKISFPQYLCQSEHQIPVCVLYGSTKESTKESIPQIVFLRDQRKNQQIQEGIDQHDGDLMQTSVRYSLDNGHYKLMHSLFAAVIEEKEVEEICPSICNLGELLELIGMNKSALFHCKVDIGGMQKCPIWGLMVIRPRNVLRKDRDTNKSTRTRLGDKLKVQLIVPEATFNNKSLVGSEQHLHRYSYDLARSIVSDRSKILGSKYFGYRYKSQWSVITKTEHIIHGNCIVFEHSEAYIDYDPSKQPLTHPPNTNTAGRFNLGIRRVMIATNQQYLQKDLDALYAEILEYIQSKDDRIHCFENAAHGLTKLFMGYKYVWKNSKDQEYSDRIIEHAAKTAGGLRCIQTENDEIAHYIPEPLQRFWERWIKGTGLWTCGGDLDQVSVNVYSNKDGKEAKYSQLCSHHESDKFQFMVSVYYTNNPQSVRTGLSFNLKNTTYDGDVLVATPHCTMSIVNS